MTRPRVSNEGVVRVRVLTMTLDGRKMLAAKENFQWSQCNIHQTQHLLDHWQRFYGLRVLFCCLCHKLYIFPAVRRGRRLSLELFEVILKIEKDLKVGFLYESSRQTEKKLHS